MYQQKMPQINHGCVLTPTCSDRCQSLKTHTSPLRIDQHNVLHPHRPLYVVDHQDYYVHITITVVRTILLIINTMSTSSSLLSTLCWWWLLPMFITQAPCAGLNQSLNQKKTISEPKVMKLANNSPFLLHTLPKYIIYTMHHFIAIWGYCNPMYRSNNPSILEYMEDLILIDSIAASLFENNWLSSQIVSVSDDKIQITLLILGRGALSSFWLTQRCNVIHVWVEQNKNTCWQS